jgi:hypothetical protein
LGLWLVAVACVLLLPNGLGLGALANGDLPEAWTGALILSLAAMVALGALGVWLHGGLRR